MKNKNKKLKVREIICALSVFSMILWIGCDSNLQVDQPLSHDNNLAETLKSNEFNTSELSKIDQKPIAGYVSS